MVAADSPWVPMSQRARKEERNHNIEQRCHLRNPKSCKIRSPLSIKNDSRELVKRCIRAGFHYSDSARAKSHDMYPSKSLSEAHKQTYFEWMLLSDRTHDEHAKGFELSEERQARLTELVTTCTDPCEGNNVVVLSMSSPLIVPAVARGVAFSLCCARAVATYQ
eukprot:3689957-Amphidinium_carterae.1